MSKDPIRTLVVDDHELFRSGLARLLDRDDRLEVVGQAGTGEEAVQRAIALRPDVVLMDLNLPGISGTEATLLIKAELPAVGVLVLTVSEDGQDVLDAVLAGASAYLLKDTPLAEIADAVCAVRAGESLVAARVTGGLLARIRQNVPKDAAPVACGQLSERERGVLQLMVHGHDNLVIAGKLHLSASTVKHHVSSILVKLGVENRIQAAVLAVRSGIGD